MSRDTASRFDPHGKLSLHTQFADYMAGKQVYPINVEISPSGLCQASCQFCFYANTGELGSHRNKVLEINRLKLLLLECKELGVKSITWTGGGEPSIYKWFDLAVEHAHNLGLEQGLFTNALAWPAYWPEYMEWIRVTMTDRPYNMEVLQELRKRCKCLGFAFNYGGTVKDNIYLKETLELATQIGADYVQVRPALAFHGQTVDIRSPEWFHQLMYVTDYKFEEAKKKHGYAECEGYHLTPFIWEDGNVDVCAYMRKHDGYTLGSIYEDSLKTILDRAPKSVPVHECCQVACKLHETNRAIHHARGLKDKNFP